MKKLLVIALLCVISISGSGIENVCAESEYIKGFKKTDTYTGGKFADVGEEWYADSVKGAYETGLMKGVNENAFNPNGQLSNAEAVTIAARIHKIYNTGKDDFAQSTPWYQTYLDYAVENGICDNSFNPDDKATRAFFVGVFANAIDSSVLTEKNDIKDGSLIDVNGWYQDAVYKMYRAGILSGNDKYGTFAPNSNITRAEVSAVAVRAVKPSSRVTVSIAERPTYTIDANTGYGLWGFKQRAIIANLKWLLNGEPQGEEWQTDVYTVEHEEIPSDNIHVSWKDIKCEYNGSSKDIFIPNRYLKKQGDAYTRVGFWNLYLGFRSSLSGYTGSMPDGDFGDLYLSKPGVAGYTETLTYANYTEEAQKLISGQKHGTPSDSELTAKIQPLAFSVIGADSYYAHLGILYLGGSCWSIGGPFSAPVGDDEVDKWCSEHTGKWVICVYGAKRPEIMFIEWNGVDSYNVKSWAYSEQSKLSIEWEDTIDFTNFVVYKEKNKELTEDVSNLKEDNIEPDDDSYEMYQKDNQLSEDDEEEVFANIDGYAKICSTAAGQCYLEGYKEYMFNLRGDGIEGATNNQPIPDIGFKSNKAYILAWDYELKIPEMKKVADDIYLPIEIINIFKIFKDAYKEYVKEYGDKYGRITFDDFLNYAKEDGTMEEIIKNI
ncbi:MAG TPA: hypothetical protein DCO93_04370 [Clostridiales bacterium]|nr:hypothetical protein [Clostridiales bacterium]